MHDPTAERIVLAIVNEAYRAVGEGVADPSDVDLALRLGAGHPSGPFERVAAFGGPPPSWPGWIGGAGPARGSILRRRSSRPPRQPPDRLPPADLGDLSHHAARPAKAHPVGGHPGDPVSPRIPSASRRRAATTYRPSIFLSAASLIAVALLAVACGGQTPGGTTTPSASASPTSSAAPSVPASPGASAPTDTPEPSVDAHGVPTLEALLPTTVGNVALEVRSLTGGDFYALGTDQTRDQLDTMLGKLDKAVTDLTVADAYDPTGRTILEVGVFRVAAPSPTSCCPNGSPRPRRPSPAR